MIDQYLKEVEEANNSAQTPYEYCPDIAKLTKMLRKALGKFDSAERWVQAMGPKDLRKDFETMREELYAELNEMAGER